MTAITVTPEMVRVVFLRRRGRRRSFSFWFMLAIISALEGMCWSLCFAAAWFLAWFTSSRVGDCIRINVSMISLVALFAFKVKVTTLKFRMVVDKLL